jgi:hypothetical protein
MDHGVCWCEEGAFHRFAEEAWCAWGEFGFRFEDGDGRVWFAGGGGVVGQLAVSQDRGGSI